MRMRNVALLMSLSIILFSVTLHAADKPLIYTGLVIQLDVSPKAARIVVDGKDRGSFGTLKDKELSLEPGQHVIDLRFDPCPPFQQIVRVLTEQEWQSGQIDGNVVKLKGWRKYEKKFEIEHEFECREAKEAKDREDAAAEEAEDAIAGAYRNIAKKLQAIYKPTSISGWDGALRAGYDVMVLTQAGVFAWPTRDDVGNPVTDFWEGKFTLRRGADNKNGAREFRKNEKVLILQIEVDSGKANDYVALLLLSFEATDRQEAGNTVSTRYRGYIVFQFPKNYLATADFADIKKAINNVLVSEREFQTVVPATVSLGMTPDEVERVLGKPPKIFDLGSKKIFVYSDLKVTFIDGRVADVQ